MPKSFSKKRNKNGKKHPAKRLKTTSTTVRLPKKYSSGHNSEEQNIQPAIQNARIEDCKVGNPQAATSFPGGLEFKDEEPFGSIIRALQRIIQNSCNSNNAQPMNYENMEKDLFCVEDTILSKDLDVEVVGAGSLNLPINKDAIDKLLNLSTKAKFGGSGNIVLNRKMQNVKIIPASQLKVTVKPTALSTLLDHISEGLVTPEGASLQLDHLNMTIYGPGQFLKKSKDAEKLEGTVATLVIVLPYPRKGGELIIEHSNKKYMFFGSQNVDLVKCVAFHCGCDHEIKVVREGYQVVLTFNIVLRLQNTLHKTKFDHILGKAVKKYFDESKKLVYVMKHSYSEQSLRWNLLKDEDLICANALMNVAKKQGRVPCLALADCHEVFGFGSEDEDSCDDEVVLIKYEREIYYCVDENNIKFTCSPRDVHVYDSDCICLEETAKLCHPYKTKKNEDCDTEYWYRRACVVLFANKWVCYQGYKGALTELHKMTREEGKEQLLLDEINSIGLDFVEKDFWISPDISDMLLDIVIYVNNPKVAMMILPKLKNILLNEKKVDCVIRLENQLESSTWNEILDIWENDRYFNNVNASDRISFITKYIQLAGETKKSHVLPGLLKKAVDDFIKANRYNIFTNIYERVKDNKIEQLTVLVKLCVDLEFKELLSKLMEHVMSTSSKAYPAISKAQLCCKLQEVLTPEQMLSHLTGLVTLTLNEVKTLLSQIGETFHWSMTITSCCQCKHLCSPVLEFFSSKTSKKFEIFADQDHKNHIDKSFFPDYEDQFIMIFDKKSYDRYAIRFEKSPVYREQHVKLQEDLLHFQRYLLEMDCLEGKIAAGVSSEHVGGLPSALC